MQVVIHAGAHMTDEDRLIQCLSKNRKILSEVGTNVPEPGAYRKLLRDILNKVPKQGISGEARDVVLDAIAHEGAADRLVLSNQAFFGTPKMAVGQAQFYPAAELRLEGFRQIFAHDELELFLAICNPATFLPALFAKTKLTVLSDFLNDFPPSAFLWSETIARIRDAFPDMPITIWCNEDTPLIWSQVVREMSGLNPTAEFDGEFTLLTEIMSETGMKRFQSYLSNHPGMTEIQKRRVIAAFLDKFVKEDAIEEELDVQGWTEDIVDGLTELYDEDIYAVQRIPGVNMITP